MKTLQELYDEIIASEELKAAFVEAAKSGKTMEFLKVHGCEATEEELAAFLKYRSTGEISDEELNNVAGGTCDGDPLPTIAMSIASLGVVCVKVAIDTAIDPNHCC